MSEQSPFVTSIVPEETYTKDSAYSSYQGYITSGGSYGDLGWMYGDRPDSDPFGSSSLAIARSGLRPLASDTVTGLRLDDGTWMSREALMKIDGGEALVRSQERINKGLKKGFWDGLSEGSITDFIPFLGMFASVGRSLHAAKRASDFYRKQIAGETTSVEEAVAATLYRTDNELSSEGTWGYTFGSIVRAAPAFFAEFGILNKLGQMARTSVAKGIVASATDEAAKSASKYAVTRAVKTGTEEYAEVAVRSFIQNEAAARGISLAKAAQSMAKNKEVLDQSVEQVSKLSAKLMNSAANAVEGMPEWAPGLQEKVSKILAKDSIDRVLFRMSPDSAVQRAYRGFAQSVSKAVAEGLIDLGSWGSEASTVLTTGHTSASKAALDAFTQLTFGAASRGMMQYLPKEVVSSAARYALGATNRSSLGLEMAAWSRDDEDLMDKADMYGVFLDLLEYVSENTGRGFNSVGRAIGLKVAPKLMAPAAKVPGVTHIVGADVTRDAAGKATKVVYNGLLEEGYAFQAGGKVSQYLEKAFGRKKLRADVLDDQLLAVKNSLAKKGIAKVEDASLMATISSGSIQPGVSSEIATVLGGDIRSFVASSVREFNRQGLDQLKTKSAIMYWIADFLTRHNIDAPAAYQMFRDMGYDGIIGEMMEERYADFTKGLFGLDANTDHSVWNNIKRAVRGAFAVDDSGRFMWDQLTAEAAAFSVPMLARAGTMRALSAIGGKNELDRFKSSAALYSDATRYGSVVPMAPGEYLKSVRTQAHRLITEARDAENKYKDEMSKRKVDADSAAPGYTPTAILTDTEMQDLLDTAKRARTAVSRLLDVKKHIFESLAPGASTVYAPVVRDQELKSSDERYNLITKTRETQENLRRSVSAAQVIVNDAPSMFQTLAKMEDKDPVKEDTGWFRRASHWVVEHAIRLSGTAVTGDISFLSANPARFSAVDLGVPGDILTRGKKVYQSALSQRVKEMLEGRTSATINGETIEALTPADYEKCHEKALADIEEESKAIMNQALVFHQTRMFAFDELRDVALDTVARDDGYVIDTDKMVVVDKNGTEIPLRDYMSEDGVAERIENTRSEYSVELYDLLSRGSGAQRTLEQTEDGAIHVRDVLTVPRDLPTARQAIIAKISRHFPQFRGVQMARKVDGNLSIDDHFDDGVSARSDWMDTIVSTILPDGVGSITADTNFDELYKSVDKVHPAILATIARDLNIHCDGTVSGIAKRNREIAELSIMRAISADSSVKVFTRLSTEAERGSSFVSPFGVDAVAKYNKNRSAWIIRISKADSADEPVLEDTTIDGLAEKLREYGYSMVNPRTVFTSYQVLQSENPLDMIRVLGLGTEYERRMSEVTENKYKDPSLRSSKPGEQMTEDDFESQRRLERMRALMYQDRANSAEPSLYLRPGETLSDKDAYLRASALANSCQDAWYRRNARFDRDKPNDNLGRGLGYIAIAQDILRENGVTVPSQMSDNRFGMASQTMRGMYSISVRSAVSRGMSRNVYVPINHVSAQDYKSALLDASLYTAYARNRMYISKVYCRLVTGFMDTVDKICKNLSLSKAADGNTDLADKIESFRVSSVAHAEGQLRLPSAKTFAQFVAAFNLFRTEVPGIWKQTILGADAEALCAVAPEVRASTSFIGWTGVVDLVLGGTGLEVTALRKGEAPKTGIGKYYAVWAPRGSKTLDKAVESALPKKMSFDEFSIAAVRNEQATAQAHVERTMRDGTVSDASDEFSDDYVYTPPVSPGPTAGLQMLQNNIVNASMTVDDAVEGIAESVGDTDSVLFGGDTSDPVYTDDTGPDSSATVPQTESSEDPGYIDDVVDYDEDQSLAPVKRFMDTTPEGIPMSHVSVDQPVLLPSEARSAVQSFVSMIMAMEDMTIAPNKKMFREFLHKIAPGMRLVDERFLESMFDELTAKDQLMVVDDFSINDSPDSDEDGITPDGHDGNNARAAEMFKSKALCNWLAMFSIVSPQTGHDFQPLMESLRESVKVSEFVVENTTPDLVEANKFLDKLLNPRSETSVGNSADRDSIWRHRMTWFETSSGHRKDIIRYINAYLGGQSGTPVNARAAVLLAYLLSIKDANLNTRMSLASLIGSSAHARPVNITRDRTSVDHMVTPYRRKSGITSMETMTSSLAALVGKTSEEIRGIAKSIEAEVNKALPSLLTDTSHMGKMLGLAAGRPLVEYARIFGKYFGYDSPLCTAFTSRSMHGLLNENPDRLSKLHTGFASQKFDKSGNPNFRGLPFAVFELVEGLKYLSEHLSGARASQSEVFSAAVDMFQCADPGHRAVFNADTSLQGYTVWRDLLSAYADARPVSVMRATVNPERTSKPASSLAITMPGIEPALLQFLDRKDEYGFEQVIKKWFPERLQSDPSKLADRIAALRQRMIWPNPQADLIVAKSVNKSAMASEVLNGCMNSYDAAEDRMVYVPVYSGDHSSSIILQVPLSAKFHEAGMSYADVAGLVSKWIGMDLLGVDPKRSAVTSMEAPGTSMRDFRYNDDGSVMTDDSGNPIQGHAYTAILWNSDPESDNEAMIGTSAVVGYAARRQKELAKDPKSSTLKIHIAATGEDRVYGPVLTLIKSLAVAPEKSGGRGQFLECSSNGFVLDHAYSIIDGQEDISSCTITDFDSIKLSQANSKTTLVDNGEDSVSLMKHVFDKLRSALETGYFTTRSGEQKKVGSEITGSDLDDLVGKITWKNTGGTGKNSATDGQFDLSQLLAGVKIKEVRRPGEFNGHRMFSLVFETDNQMAFQVANVSHKAKTEFSRTPRNYMVDALAMARTLPKHNGGAELFPGAERVCENVVDLVSSWGVTASAVASDTNSLDNILHDDEKWIAAREHGMTIGGDIDEDFRRRAFAAKARKDTLSIQFNNQSAALVTNSGWIGKDGMGHSHSSSRMFNDTLNGPRTIKISDREFLRGNKRVGLANVNNSDPSFRHGLYIQDEKKFLSDFKGFLDIVEKKDSERKNPDGTPAPSQLTGDFRRVVSVLDMVITEICNSESTGRGRQDSLRKKLASHLIDHHGIPFSTRAKTRSVAVKGADGKYVMKDGKVVREPRAVPLWQDVSFFDLMTNVNSRSGVHQTFDRTAVYESMFNDATGKSHIYLGGTLMGIPRTPSYNGSMWLQNVRAALPVTEISEKNSEGKVTQWSSGIDSMVAPDPFTLKILGCDHDGDKTNLYMLRPTNGRVEYADIRDLRDGIDDFITRYNLCSGSFAKLSGQAREDLSQHISDLVEKGYVEYEKTRTKGPDGAPVTRTGGLVFTTRGAARISNSFVSSLFSMNKMLPVSDNSDTEVSVYDGYSDKPGSMFRGVKAQPIDPDVWKSVIKQHEAATADGKPSMVGPRLLDASVPGKNIGNNRIAAAVQDGSSMVAETRAITVSAASALHLSYYSGMKIGVFSMFDSDPREWIDFMYHVDGLSNMTFDDIKEQICTRLGIRPNMITSILADIINESRLTGHLPTTDKAFADAFVKYGTRFNDKNDSRHWMARASDPSDYAFQALFDELAPGFFLREYESSTASAFGVVPGEEIDADLLMKAGEERKGTVLDKFRIMAINEASAYGKAPEAFFGSAIMAFKCLTDAATDVKSPLNGFTYWLVKVAKSADLAPRPDGTSTFSDLLDWLEMTYLINEGSSFSKSINYTVADPASPDASATAKRLRTGFERLTKGFISSDDPRLSNGELTPELVKAGYTTVVPDRALRQVRRMRASAALMYDDSIGQTVTSRGVSAAVNFRKNLETVVVSYGRTPYDSSDIINETQYVAALLNSARIRDKNVVECESNAQSVPWTVAAFLSTPSIEGSPMNSRNIYAVLDRIGAALAHLRHPDNPGSNTTLDVRYGIEAMFDLVARFVKNSEVHNGLDIFSYLRETPDANEYGYSVAKYGKAATGLSRLRPAMDMVTDHQREYITKLYDRVVIGRELDSVNTKKAYKSTTGYTPSYNLGFELSAENIEAMARFLPKRDQQVARTKQEIPANLLSAVATPGKRRKADAFETGANRDLYKTIDELRFVFTGKYRDENGKLVQMENFKGLEGIFGKGFTIEPSALFGQILPIYACMTARVTGVAGTDTSSLLSIMPDWVYSRIDHELARIRKSNAMNLHVETMTALSFSPVVITGRTKTNGLGDVVGLPDLRIKTMKRQADDSASAAGRIYSAAAAYASEYAYGMYPLDVSKEASLAYFAGGTKSSPYNKIYAAVAAEPSNHHTLCIFDGPRGLAFKSLISNLQSKASQASRPESTKKPAPQKPVLVAPAHVSEASVLPSRAVSDTVTVQAPSTSSVKDEFVESLANRMSALTKMWDAGRVEYAGGNKFYIYGKFHEDLAESNEFETRLEVVVEDRDGLYTAEQIRSMSSGPRFLQSLAESSGKTVAELKAMSSDERTALALKFNAAGASRTFKPGETVRDGGKHSVMDSIGQWRIDATSVGVLAGQIRIAKGSKDPDTIYHEYFHSVMGFLRTLGSLSKKDVDTLVAKYGEHAKYGKAWFNEERAANEFKRFVSGKIKPENKDVDGVWAKIKNFLTSLYQLVFSSGNPVSHEYSNDMYSGRNPLLSVTLTGRVKQSVEPSHEPMKKMTPAERLSYAVSSYRKTMISTANALDDEETAKALRDEVSAMDDESVIGRYLVDKKLLDPGALPDFLRLVKDTPVLRHALAGDLGSVGNTSDLEKIILTGIPSLLKYYGPVVTSTDPEFPQFRVGQREFMGIPVVWETKGRPNGSASWIVGASSGIPVIHMYETGLREKFRDQAWKKPLRSAPLEKDVIRTFDDFLQFTALRELGHTKVDMPKSTPEEQYARETATNKWATDRMNEYSSDTLNEKYGASSGTLLRQIVADYNAKHNTNIAETVTKGVHDVSVSEVESLSVSEDGFVLDDSGALDGAVQVTGESLDDAYVLPNAEFASDIADALSGATLISPDHVSPEDYGMSSDVDLQLNEVHSEIDREISRVFPRRMSRPYLPVSSLALQIGQMISAGMPEAPDFATRDQKVNVSIVQKQTMLNAVHQVGSLFGVDVSDTAKVEKTLFKSMCQLYDRVNPDGLLVGNIRTANGERYPGESMVTPNALASAIITASGVRPSTVIELTVKDVQAIADRYPGENTFKRNVINPVLSVLSRLSEMDPTHVMYEGPSEDSIGPLLSRLRAGLRGGDMNTDGNRRPFTLGSIGVSDNPDHDANIARYSDHIDNPDFHELLHLVLDRIYTLQAAMRWYKQIGFEPGDPSETIAVRGLAPNSPDPMTHGETMAALSVTPGQFDDPTFSAIDFYDQPAFIANHPDTWLDSMLRPGFGTTSFRDMAQEQKRQIAGFHSRANHLDGLIIRALGLDISPDGFLTAIDDDYTSKFVMRSGKTVHEDNGRYTKVQAYSGKYSKTADGKPIPFTLDDQRNSDMTYKMWKVMAQGGDIMVTGVDGLVFSSSDVYDDPAYYGIDKVRERKNPGVAVDYSDFDRFLDRMYLQLHDSGKDAPWDAVVGSSGLDLYNRIVTSACKAMKDAHVRMNVKGKGGTPSLDKRGFNDEVLRSLMREGLIQTMQNKIPGSDGYVMTQGALVISAKEWMNFWKHKSGTYKKLKSAGRTEQMLEFNGESFAKQLIDVYNEMRRFVDAHPFFSDGDGSFFHNMATQLPWFGGSGYFMYGANRNEQEKTDLLKNSETLGVYEKEFAKLIGDPSLEFPAVTASDNIIRLVRILFHTHETDVESVRTAINSGEYTRYGISPKTTKGELAEIIYNKLSEMLWTKTNDIVPQDIGGAEAVARMVKYYDKNSIKDGAVVKGGNGLRDEFVYRTNGVLPANYQLGHAIKRAIDGITNAYAFRATLFNMLTTPDEDGMPTCYAKPADDAQDSGGIPDSMWGVIARWWAQTNGLESEYDINASGVRNAQHIFDKVSETIDNGVRTMKNADGTTRKIKYGELKKEDIDPRSITSFIARTSNPEDESTLGDYAMGYAKHLFQSTRTLGNTARTKFIHRAWAWSKGLSVNFSYFFPLATRFESPIGAVGSIATFGGNVSPDWIRNNPELARKMQSVFGKSAWITKDFLGWNDIMDMMDSNDPYLSELYHWAGILGIQLSDPDNNPMEHSRSYLRQDLDKVVAYIKRNHGSSAAKRAKGVLDTVLLKGGERAFTYHLNATKLAVTAQMCLKLQVEAAKNGRAFDPVRDLRRYSSYINAEVGGIDPLQFSWAHPAMQSKLNSLFFSWGWTRGAWEAGGGTVLEQVLFGGHSITPNERRNFLGRWVRMFGEVMIGVPMVMQFASKGMAKLMMSLAGIDPEKETTPEARAKVQRLVDAVNNGAWFTWNNEEKVGMSSFDITPLMAAVSAVFPSYSKFAGKTHPWVKTAAGLVGAAIRNPLLLTLAAPTYEGEDDRNSTTRGRRYYCHFGKQGWEFFRWFDNPVKQALSKTAMPIQRLAEGVFGRSLTYMDHPQPWDKQGDVERWVNPTWDGASFNLLRAFVPFSMASLGDTSEAGFISLAAPVTMGASGSDLKRAMAEHLGRWASNDRDGYAFGGQLRKSGKRKYGKLMAGRSVTVANLLREARLNGYTEKESFKIVDEAVTSLTGSLYSRILDEMPTDADETVDAGKMSSLLREANRLGRLRKDMEKALADRLKKQHRWQEMGGVERGRMRDILRQNRTESTAYDTTGLDSVNNKVYDY